MTVNKKSNPLKYEVYTSSIINQRIHFGCAVFLLVSDVMHNHSMF